MKDGQKGQNRKAVLREDATKLRKSQQVHRNPGEEGPVWGLERAILFVFHLQSNGRPLKSLSTVILFMKVSLATETREAEPR